MSASYTLRPWTDVVHLNADVESDNLTESVFAIDLGAIAEGDPNVPDEHVAVWFGYPKCKRTSEGGTGGSQAELWTIPEELLIPASPPLYKH